MLLPIKKTLSVLILLTLCSCGFKPLYQTNEASLGQVAISNEIFIDVIADREGQILRNLLRNKISKAGQNAKYKLKVNLSINSTDVGINIDDVATRKILWLSASFELLDGEEVVSKGRTSNNVSYAINDNEFVTLTARNNEIEKSLHILADDIKLKISSVI